VNVAVATATMVAGSRARLVLREANDPVAEHRFTGVAGAARRRLVRWAYGRAHAVVALTHGNAEAVVTHLGVRPERVHVIPNPAPTVVGESIAAAEGPEGRPRLVCVARLARQKDHATLLDALARLPDAALALLGDGPLRGELEDRAAALGLTPRVRFVGDVDDVAPWWAWADVAVLSSRWEGFPNVLLEALAHGVPVVATDCPTGPREVIGSTSDVGALVPIADPDALAAALARVAAAPPTAAALRARALAFDLDALGARWLEVCGIAAPPGPT
jgi:glycosyltransferase involved in cell wall biosynthesis